MVDMTTNFQQDLAFNSDFIDANWDVTTGELIGTGDLLSTPSPFSTGTVDVVLQANRSYEMSTDIGEIVDVTNIATPLVILSGANNPGSGDGEFHCRTFLWEANANVMLFGDNPLVIRCSGTGMANDIVARFNRWTSTSVEATAPPARPWQRVSAESAGRAAAMAETVEESPRSLPSR